MRDVNGRDPWGQRANGTPNSAAPNTDSVDGPNGKLPLVLNEPIGNIGHENRPIFDVKMSLQEEMKFDGAKHGMKWKSRTERYFISCAPVLMNILSWAEKQDNNIIDIELFGKAVGTRLSQEQSST